MKNETAALHFDFDMLVEKYYELLYRFAYKLSGNYHAAMDLTQQAFLIAARKRDQLRNPSRAKSWIFTILYREFLKEQRHKQRFPEEEHSVSSHELAAPESRLADRLDGSLLTVSLAQLPERYRLPMVLFYQEDMAYREIADYMGVPIGTIMSRLDRAKLLLRTQLGLNKTTRPGKRASHSRPSRRHSAPAWQMAA